LRVLRGAPYISNCAIKKNRLIKNFNGEKMGLKKLTPRDIFECEYIQKHMPQDVYCDAKNSLESLRDGDGYSDDNLNFSFGAWLNGEEWPLDEHPQIRIGDVKVGGEITEEFKNV
jgi:hypothetical protein